MYFWKYRLNQFIEKNIKKYFMNLSKDNSILNFDATFFNDFVITYTQEKKF